MNNILKRICDKKKSEIEFDKKKYSLKTLEKLIDLEKTNHFDNLLKDSQNRKKNNIIAEIKKGSPSAGIIIDDYKPEIIAIEYEKAGAGAISILTEKNFFYGNLDHMSLINKNINLPILRKDFIFDHYQILQSKVYNADAILLIATILTNNQIKDFLNLAKDCNLKCLIEVHNKEELLRIIKIGHRIIGINNRNLTNLKIDINNTLNLINLVPKDYIVVAESGIKTKEDIKNYNNQGIYNFLIGESILKNNDVNKKIKSLIN